jgi:peptidoglycan-N-acetylglucosamine deacetylase
MLYWHTMKGRSRVWCAIAVMTALAGPALAGEPRAELQAACWVPSALAAKLGENIPQRRQRPIVFRAPDAALASLAQAQTAGAGLGVVRRVALPAGERLLALTFDLCETAGETAGYDGAIIDYLRANRVKATLFAGGQWLISHRERAQQLLSDPLFEIGTHGWVHRNTRLLGGGELRREMLAPSLAFASLRSEMKTAQCVVKHEAAFSAIPERPTLLRFAFGACNGEGLQVAADAGMIAVQWDVATGDPSPNRPARAIAETMIRNARPGSIIIAHANGRGYHTAEALPLAIPVLRARGFSFVTVSELMAAGRPVLAETCYDSRPGDTDKYDTLFAHRPMASPTSVPAQPHVRAAPTLPQ